MLQGNLKIAPGCIKAVGKNLCRNAWFGRNFAMASIQVDVLITVSINTEVWWKHLPLPQHWAIPLINRTPP